MFLLLLYRLDGVKTQKQNNGNGKSLLIWLINTYSEYFFPSFSCYMIFSLCCLFGFDVVSELSGTQQERRKTKQSFSAIFYFCFLHPLLAKTFWAFPTTKNVCKRFHVAILFNLIFIYFSFVLFLQQRTNNKKYCSLCVSLSHRKCIRGTKNERRLKIEWWKEYQGRKRAFGMKIMREYKTYFHLE